jgi:histidyl-tRNA synthetase
MALSTQPYKGARDFYPEQKRLQTYMFTKIRQVVHQYGYEEYDAPILEPLELYLAKSGDEIVNEQTYTFTDRGGRQVVIRPEMTPTVSRMVAAKRQELGYPLRWFSIPNLWRYERPQRGRLREHWQLNVDIFGVANTQAELEVIMVADRIYRSFGATTDMYEIRINSRKFMDYVLSDYLGLDGAEAYSMAKLIDRMNKMERGVFLAQADLLFTPSIREAGALEKLVAVLDAKKFEQLPEVLQDHETVADIRATLVLLKDSGINNVRFDSTLMRGFDYYTDIVFEVFDLHPDNNRAMMGGGRYDGLIALFGVETLPTVGFGLGDVPLANFLEAHGLLPNLRVETDLYVVIVGDVQVPAQKIVAELRTMGLNVAVDLSGRKLGDQFKTAEKKSVQHALIIGAKELDDQQFKLKNLVTGTEETHGLARIVSIVKDHRKVDEFDEAD